MTKLSAEEIELLITGLDKIEISEAQGDAMVDMVSAIMTGGVKAAAQDVLSAKEKMRRERKPQREKMRDRCILLKAKLVTMRREVIGESSFTPDHSTIEQRGS